MVTGMNKQDIEKLIRPEIRALSAYHVPKVGDVIKLDAMENPYRWPEGLVAQWLELLKDVELNRYPDPAAYSLNTRLRQAMNIPADAGVVLGNGSDELIQMILLAIAEGSRSVLSVTPSFVMYKMISTFVGMQYIGVPLREDFSLDMEAMLAAIEAHQPAVVFLAYPNNPSGNLFGADEIIKIIDAAPGLVVVDEAYHAFADSTFMEEVLKYDNLLVMRTLSKMGLAGLRLGLLVGGPSWLQEIDKVRLPYNINVLTQASADFALQNRDVLDEQTQRICKDREMLFQQLSEIESLTVYPSRANFILFRAPSGQANDIFAGLKEKGVLIKNLDAAGGLLKDCLRVTVGKAEENRAFIEVLSDIL